MTSDTGQASFVINLMLSSYIKRGAVAGTIGGLGYGLFVTFVTRPLVRFTESFEVGGSAYAGPALTTTALTSIGASVLWGLLIGTVTFGVVYYFFEPALPGARDTQSYVLSAIGFITISGAPWLLFPPQPPGVEQTVPTQTRLVWYGIMMASGGFVSGAAVYSYTHLSSSFTHVTAGFVSLTLFLTLLVPLAAAPTNIIRSSLPMSLLQTFRWITATGQVWLWLLLASAHAWLERRALNKGEMEALQPDSKLQTASDLE